MAGRWLVWKRRHVLSLATGQGVDGKRERQASEATHSP